MAGHRFLRGIEPGMEVPCSARSTICGRTPCLQGRRSGPAGLEEGLGLQVEFESFPDIELAFESLARERQGIELLNVRQEGNRTHATVFVPDGKLDHFEGLVRDYLEEKRGQRLDVPATISG